MSHHSLKESILEKVTTGKVHMRSKWYFVMRSVLLALGLFVVFGILLYLLSFIMFMLQQSGVWFAPQFGFMGVRILFGALPWIIILIVLIGLGVLEYLVRKYSIGYRTPLVYSGLGIIAIVVVTSLLVKQAPLHEQVYERVHEGNFSVMKPLYKGIEHLAEEVHPGIVQEITEDGFFLLRKDDVLLQVSTSTNTHFPFFEFFEEGDPVMVIGTVDGDTIDAQGVRTIPEKGAMHPQKRKKTEGHDMIWYMK